MARDVRYKKLLIVLGLLAVIMATAITVTSISVLTSQIRDDRDQTVTGAAELAAKEIDAAGTQLAADVVDAFLHLADKGELRAPDDVGGGTFDDISNIHKKQG